MKGIKYGVILTTFILIFGMAAYAISAQNMGNEGPDNKVGAPTRTPQDNTNKTGNAQEKQDEVPGLVLSGIVEYRDLEGGFYELDGYRLTGDFDFSQYKEKFVVASGDLDNSPGIYMVKAAVVRSIIIKDAPDFEDRMEELIGRYTEALKAAEQAGKPREETELISNNLAMLQLILSQNVKFAEGKYVGQADNNVIEIEISKGPELGSFRTFQLSDLVKEKFGDLKLNKGDTIIFKYQEIEGQNAVIHELERK